MAQRAALSAGLSAVAGEYFVAAELSRQGYVASPTLRHTRGIDILVSTADATRAIGVRVKTKQGRKAAWVLSEKVERDDLAEILVFVFVALNDQSPPDYYVVPLADVAAYTRRRPVHDLADLLGVGLGERPPKNGEVLREDVDQLAVDAAVAGDHAVAVDPLVLETEVGGAVRDDTVVLDEGAFVEEQVEALVRGELALVVLGLDAGRSATLFGLRSPLFQELEFVAHGHGRISCAFRVRTSRSNSGRLAPLDPGTPSARECNGRTALAAMVPASAPHPTLIALVPSNPRYTFQKSVRPMYSIRAFHAVGSRILRFRAIGSHASSCWLSPRPSCGTRVLGGLNRSAT